MVDRSIAGRGEVQGRENGGKGTMYASTKNVRRDCKNTRIDCWPSVSIMNERRHLRMMNRRRTRC
jgi:hypothetical protein